MIGRAPDQAVGGVGDRLHCAHPPGQILATAAAQPVQAVTLAVLLEGEQLALLGIGFEIVETGDGLGGVLERGVAGNVVNRFGPDIDGPSVAHAFELFFSADQH